MSSSQSPTGNSFNVTATPASESDLVGCDEPDKSSATGFEIISSIMMFCLLVVVVKFM